MICTKCNTEFEPTPKQRRRLCKPCFRAYNNDYYANNANRRKSIKESNLARVRDRKDFVDSYKSACGCHFCDEKTPICLDLHHLDADTKDEEISRLVSNGSSFSRIKTEIEKCVVVCRNCHAKIHAGLLRI